MEVVLINFYMIMSLGKKIETDRSWVMCVCLNRFFVNHLQKLLIYFLT